MPIRVVDCEDRRRNQRAFRFGNLQDSSMLEERLSARSKQLPATIPVPGLGNAFAQVGEFMDPERSCSARWPATPRGAAAPIERQRQAVEFFAPLLWRREVERYLGALGATQDRMGALNDLFVARARHQTLGTPDPAAWFALGWRAVRMAEVRALAKPELARLAKADAPKPRNELRLKPSTRPACRPSRGGRHPRRPFASPSSVWLSSRRQCSVHRSVRRPS
jgi:hypothetical protein